MMASLPTPPPEGSPEGSPVPMYEPMPLPLGVETGPVLEETTPPPEEASTSLSSHPSLAPLDHQLLSTPSSSLGPMSSSGPLGPIHPGASAWDPLAAPEWDSTPPSFTCLNRCIAQSFLVKQKLLINQDQAGSCDHLQGASSWDVCCARQGRYDQVILNLPFCTFIFDEFQDSRYDNRSFGHSL